MESPDEMIEYWKRMITKTKERNMLKVIKLDLEEEKEMFEEVVRNYECLISDIEDKSSELGGSK